MESQLDEKGRIHNCYIYTGEGFWLEGKIGETEIGAIRKNGKKIYTYVPKTEGCKFRGERNVCSLKDKDESQTRKSSSPQSLLQIPTPKQRRCEFPKNEMAKCTSRAPRKETKQPSVIPAVRLIHDVNDMLEIQWGYMKHGRKRIGQVENWYFVPDKQMNEKLCEKQKEE